MLRALARKEEGREALIFVPFCDVIERNVPFVCTVAFGAKPLPKINTETGTVEVGFTPRLPGETETIVGLVAAITSWVGVVVLAPGPGLFTEISPEPKLWRSFAVSVTCRVVLFTKVVGRSVPLYSTTELASKPLPVTVTVAGAPCGTLRGDRPVTLGVGLITRNLVAADEPPPGEGFDRTRLISCPAASAAAGTAT
jgi:hypothetical protein